MHTLAYKHNNAHDDSIWACDWGELRTTKPIIRDDLDKGDESDDELQELSSDCIVTGSIDETVKIWNYDKTTNLNLDRTLCEHSLGVISVALNSDASIVASSALDATLMLWKTTTGEKIKTFSIGPVELWTIAFSPDDNYIISGSHSGKINLFGVETGKQEQTFDTRGIVINDNCITNFWLIFLNLFSGKFTLSIAYSPDGKYIACGALDGIINVFDVLSGKLTHTLEGHAMPIRSLCFSSDSKYLLTGADDGQMKIYAVHHAEVLGTVSGHASWVLSVDFSPDCKSFVSGSADNTVKVWDVANRSCLNTLKEHKDKVWCVKYNSTGDKMVSVSEDSSINIYSSPS